MKCWYCGNSNFEHKVDNHNHPYDLCLDCGASTVPMTKIDHEDIKSHIDVTLSRELGKRVTTYSPSHSMQRKAARARLAKGKK